MDEKIVQTLLSELQKISRAETVVGEAIQSGGATIVPISRVQIGFGAGDAGGNGNGGVEHGSRTQFAGLGGGIRVEPVACVVVNREGQAQLLSLSSQAQNTVAKAIDLLPEVLDRFGISKPKENPETKKK